ncbi:hypothetical protein AAFC00_006002 [Neodothiora populina]|uniref:Pentatricopeptide repeat protein n=1 Tax=Neodothiora populina TaxID=2781224 RepID=A0ABR3P6L9_9PEZI
MMECHSCLLRCLRAIAEEAAPTLARPGSRTTLSRYRASSRTTARVGAAAATNTAQGGRGYATYHGAAAASSSPDGPSPSMPTTEVARHRGRERYEFQGRAREERERDSDQPKPFDKDRKYKSQNLRRKIATDTPDTAKAIEEVEFGSNMDAKLERAVKKELVYLKDPLKHANHVRQTLRENDIEKALALCRIASKEMQVIVSWNHTIDWLLARRHLKLAIKTYNEMKKRAQFPDSHTYLILLRGLAIPPVHMDTVSKAVTIYHSLAAPNSRVQQSIIHTNAAIKVCARAGDMDSLWGIASRIPEKGPAAADHFTFTTILNAIRENALLEAGPRVDDNAAAQIRETAVQEGRRMWQDIVGKWRKGDLLVDEEMVCAMGRLLLLGLRPRDWDDVLSLVEQTMNIPRLAAKLGTPARKAEHLPMPRVLKQDAEPNPDEEEIMGEFDKELLSPKRIGRSGSVAYVSPSNNTLSLVMEACLKMASTNVASQYWTLLTAEDSYNVVPDMDNLNMYLRLLRQSRSSTRVVETLKTQVLDRGLRPMRKTFRIAMSACGRDKNNPAAIQNAGAILDMMEKNASEMDVKAAQIFLDLSIGSKDGKVISHAINRLGPVVQNLRSQVSYGSDRGGAVSDAIRAEALLLFRTIIGAIDVLMNQNLVPREEFVSWTSRRSRLAAYVTRVNSKVSGTAPFTDEDKLARRKESRQLANLRRNTMRRAKKAEGVWEDRKKRQENAKQDARPQEDAPKVVTKLADSPADL